MNKPTVWIYVAILLLGVSGVATSFSLIDKTYQINKLESQITSLEERLGVRVTNIESGLIGVKSVLEIYQQANEEQVKVNQSLLNFMKIVNHKQGQE